MKKQAVDAVKETVRVLPFMWGGLVFGALMGLASTEPTKSTWLYWGIVLVSMPVLSFVVILLTLLHRDRSKT